MLNSMNGPGMVERGWMDLLLKQLGRIQKCMVEEQQHWINCTAVNDHFCYSVLDSNE